MPPNYFCRSRWLNSVEDTGLEPVTSCVQDKRSPKTELIPQIKNNWNCYDTTQQAYWRTLRFTK